jgi:hypothetical protein
MALRAFRPAHEHEWFNQDSTRVLRGIAQTMQLSFNVVKHFSGNRVMDTDLVWIVSYPDDRMLSVLGLNSGQAEMLRMLADQAIVEVSAYADGSVRRHDAPFTSGLNDLQQEVYE